MKNINGFTLVELMIVIAIAALLLTVAIPSFQNSIRQNRMATQANDLMTTFNNARTEAVRRSSPITICSSTNQISCDGVGGNDWSVGWITFQDLNGNNVFNDDADANLCETNAVGEAIEDCLLRIQTALPASASLTTVATDAITYQADSTRGRPAPAAVAMTLRADNCGANEQRDISISALGQISIVRNDCP